MVLLTLTLRAKVKQMKGYEGCASSLLSLVWESIEYQKVGEFRKMELSPQVRLDRSWVLLDMHQTQVV